MAFDWSGAEPELEAAARNGYVPYDQTSGSSYTVPFEPQPDTLPVKPPPAPIPEVPGTHSPIPPDPSFNFKPFEPIAAPTFSPVPSVPGALPSVDPEADKNALKAAIAVGPDVSTERIRQSDALKAAKKNLTLLQGERANTQDELTAHNVKVAGDISKDASQRLIDRQEMEKEAREQRAKIEAESQRAKDAAKELREKHAKDYERSFLQTEGAAKTWISILSTGLGEIGKGLAAMGGVNIGNTAFSIMEKMFSEQAAREKGRLLRQKEEIERRGEDVSRIDQKLKDFDTITMPQMRAALLERGIERREALMASHGATKEQIEGDLLSQKMKAEALKDTIQLETQLGDRVRVSNENQNQLKRQLALQSAKAKGPGSADRPDDKLTEGERKAQGALNGTLSAAREATKYQYTDKDKKVIDEIVSAARNVEPGESTKFWGMFSQIRGKHYDQLSPGGKKRFDNVYRAAQNQERILSGAVINPHEIADVFGSTKDAGSEKLFFDRSRDLLPATGQPEKFGAEILRRETETFGRKADPRQQSSVMAEASQLLRSTRDPQTRAALDFVIKNPSDPRSSAILSKAKSQ